MNEDKPSKTIKPNLNAAIPAAIMGSAIGAVLIAAGSWLFVDAITAQLAIIMFTVITVLLSVLSYGNLQSRKYLFYSEHIEVYEGFLTVTQDNIDYTRITDVSFSKSVWQRLFSVGTIKLNTAGSDHYEISISYINDPESVYDEIKTIIGM